MSNKSMWGRARRYYEARGLPWKSWGGELLKGEKFQEEAGELFDAITAYNEGAGTAEEVREEIADVAITLAWIARRFDTSIESCIKNKTRHDAGRGAGKRYRAGI